MTRILITGLSGVGKSAVVAALNGAGHWAVDADDAPWSMWIDVEPDDDTPGTPVEPGRDWVWNPNQMGKLLADAAGGVLFVAGTSPNMGQFRSRFDRIILLTAPAAVMADRLRTRTNNSYGQREHEVQRAVDLIESVEPLLREVADVEIDTSRPLAAVVAEIVDIAEQLEHRAR